MKNNIAKIVAMLLCALMMFAIVGCDNTGSEATPAPTVAPTEAVETPKVILPDVPADRYDAVASPRTGNNATMPLVISTYTLDGKFSPFFYTSAYDNDVQALTQIGLLHYDKDGAPQAGVEYPSYAWAYSQEVSDDKSTSTYKFILKNGITFSDGTPVTAKDVLFSMYVYCDPLYDGASTFYTMAIQGLSEYRLQTSSDVLELMEAIIAAGFTIDETGAMVFPSASGVTAEQQATFWAPLPEIGAQFTQEIIDYVVASYGTDEYVKKYVSENLSWEQLNASDSTRAAFGMSMWNLGSLDDELVFTDAIGTVYDLKTAELTAADLWKAIVTAYNFDVTDSGAQVEAAGSTILIESLRSAFIASAGSVEGGVPSISGITSGVEVCEDGVEREYIQVVMNGVDPTAIFKLGVAVAPWQYYTQGFAGELNEFGVSLSDPDFIQCLKDKNVKPVGAGPYIFEEFKDNVVYYTANDAFMLGSPKIQYVRYQVIDSGAELDAVKTGTVYYSNPSAKTDIINDVTGGQGDYAKLAYILVDNDGYGYIGVNAQFVPEWNVRRALASTMNLQLCIDNTYGELATLNYRTMTKVQWAYPENPENMYPYDGTGATAKALFLEEGYIYDEAANIMYYPETFTRDGVSLAGQQVTFKATLPMEAKDHPAGSIFIDMQTVLASIGVKFDIEVDDKVLNKLSTAYESGIQIWAAAWGSGGVDPDMFQIWYSDPAVNQSTSPTAKGLYWMFANGSDEEKAALQELNELIIAGRSTLDVEERKAIYARALELSTSLTTEIPTYQRKNMFVFNKDVINAETLFSGDDVTPFQSPLAYIWNVELNG